MTKKIGRNDPCPCGSGKKYKKCCEQRLGSKKKFTASVISAGTPTPLKDKAMKISTDFFSKPIAPPSEKKIEASHSTPEGPRKHENDEPHHPPEADKPM